VIRTRVGYTGGTSKNPTYHNLGQHTESMQIDYDPAQISYADLLKVFWGTHNACRQAYSRQYMSAIFYHNDEQKKLALQTRDTKAQLSGKVFTEIVPLETFYLAEDYHQKYYLQQNDALTQEFKLMYPDAEGFINSTAAARVNGYFGRHGDRKTLDAEVKRYGLSDEAQAYIARLVRK
jgi:peptide-methionine (S)-S-oxide reductase